jgi:hypothetical protein
MIGVLPVLVGLAVGVGLFVLIRELVPAPPQLRAALDQLAEPPRPVSRWPSAATPDTAEGTAAAAQRRLGGWLAETAGAGRLLRVPAADLAILRRSPEMLLARKVLLALYGLALPAALSACLAALGLSAPVALPAICCVGFAAVLFVLPDLSARRQAQTARTDFRRTLGAYFDLVALERAAEGGPGEALERAARVGGGWAFARIRDTLARARLAGAAPWTALTELADEVGVAELADLADTVALAGGDGAAIYDTLLAKAHSMRGAALSAAAKSANSRSETMALPTALLGLGFVVLVGYPAFARIIGGGGL